MDIEKMRQAAKLAREFDARVEILIDEERSREGYPSPKHRGAVRRASMDLTRALAEMRRPG